MQLFDWIHSCACSKLYTDISGGSQFEEATGLAFRFIIGKTSDKAKMLELKKEVAEYDDFLLLGYWRRV